MTIRKAFKGFTHDLRPPIQGGNPIWAGELPFTLPTVELDTSIKECATGWHACASIEDVLEITGLWPDGHSLRVYEVEGNFIERGKKLRTSTMVILREMTDNEIEDGIREFSKIFIPFAEQMASAQIDWRRSFLSTTIDAGKVEMSLRTALEKRKLPWTLKRFEDARGAWNALDARGAWNALDARDAKAAWNARDAWNVRNARGTWNTWDARDAKASLIWRFSTLQKLILGDPDTYTVGIIDAYVNGLASVCLTGPNELGWTMRV